METIKKEHYETPSTKTVVVKFEGIVCGSPIPDPDDYENGGDPFGF